MADQIKEKEQFKSSAKESLKQNSSATNGTNIISNRVDVSRTHKLYVNGSFVRSESGRYFIQNNKQGEALANISRGSRKDFREAVVAARKAQEGWAKRSAYNRGQILFRLAEMMEGRKKQLVDDLVEEGLALQHAMVEVDTTIDRVIYYAGWTDKFIQVFSSVNPVESSHFNFSVPEPTGIVALIAPEEPGILGLISTVIPTIAGGNTVVVLASEKHSISTVSLTEIMHTSDIPAGVINVLTGFVSELASHFASHMDVNAISYSGEDVEVLKLVQEKAALNVKRVLLYPKINWSNKDSQSPYLIMDFQEIKTTWHPIGF